MSSEVRTRRVSAPCPSHPDLRSFVLDVECAENEEVVWLWIETAAGSLVSGYRLVPRQSS